MAAVTMYTRRLLLYCCLRLPVAASSHYASESRPGVGNSESTKKHVHSKQVPCKFHRFGLVALGKPLRPSPAAYAEELGEYAHRAVIDM